MLIKADTDLFLGVHQAVRTASGVKRQERSFLTAHQNTHQQSVVVFNNRHIHRIKIYCSEGIKFEKAGKKLKRLQTTSFPQLTWALVFYCNVSTISCQYLVIFSNILNFSLNLLGSHWLIKVIQSSGAQFNTAIHHLYITFCVHHPKPDLHHHHLCHPVPSSACPTPFPLAITILLSVSVSFSVSLLTTFTYFTQPLPSDSCHRY